jgi:hypothetical protein
VSAYFKKVDRRCVNPSGLSTPSFEQVIVAGADSQAQQKAEEPVEDPVGSTLPKKVWLLGGHFPLRSPSMGKRRITEPKVQSQLTIPALTNERSFNSLPISRFSNTNANRGPQIFASR